MQTTSNPCQLRIEAAVIDVPCYLYDKKAGCGRKRSVRHEVTRLTRSPGALTRPARQKIRVRNSRCAQQAQNGEGERRQKPTRNAVGAQVQKENGQQFEYRRTLNTKVSRKYRPTAMPPCRRVSSRHKSQNSSTDAMDGGRDDT
jgi:hypothetical protein